MGLMKRFVSFLIRVALICFCGLLLSVFGAYLVIQAVLYSVPLHDILGLGVGHMSGLWFAFWSYWLCYLPAIGVGVWLVAKPFKEPSSLGLALAASSICFSIFLTLPFALSPEYSFDATMDFYLGSDVIFLLHSAYAALSLLVYNQLMGFVQSSHNAGAAAEG